MTESAANAAAREAAPGVFVIDISGNVTGASEAVLIAAYAKAGAGGAHTIVLNLLALEYMNSGGIGLLVMLLVRARRSGQRMLAFGLSQHYREILELTRLDEAIEIHLTEAAALQSAAARTAPDHR